MSDTEKITINIGTVDLGQIDLLVAEGFFSNRADFIRTAIRNQLDKNQDAVKESSIRRATVMGILSYTKKNLEQYKSEGKKLDIRVIGALVLTADIGPDLACDVIQSVLVFGQFRAREDVKLALDDRVLKP